MNDNNESPARLKDRHDQPDLVERIAGQAARDTPEPPPLSASALARIAARIEERTSKPRTLRFGRVLVAASVLLGIATVASAARMDLIPQWMAKMVGMDNNPAVDQAPRPVKPRFPTRKTERPTGQAAAPAELPAKEAVQPETPAPTKTTEPSVPSPLPQKPASSATPENRVIPHRKLAMLTNDARPGRMQVQDRAQVPAGQSEAPMFARPPQPSPTNAWQPPEPETAMLAPSERPAPPTPPDPLPAPSKPAPAPALPTPSPVMPATNHNPAARHLKDVVHALRVDHAPRTALELLDRHSGELKGNAFAEEALLLRVEAMLALRQQPEALRLLDGMSLANAPSSSVLLVTRGQLRASANRCAEAVTDFDLALTRALRPSKQALLGRARCKQKLGDPSAAQADLDRLHREFPGEPAP